MDDNLREELKAWLEFYRELGIEDFYRREPGAREPSVSLLPAKPVPAAAAPLPKLSPPPTSIYVDYLYMRSRY